VLLEEQERIGPLANDHGSSLAAFSTLRLRLRLSARRLPAVGGFSAFQQVVS
jgi:hypothetical protein